MKNFKSKVILAVIMTSVMISAIPIQAEVVGTDNNDQSISSSNLTLQGERIYQIMTDRFYDGDTSNNAKGEALRYQEVTAEDMTYMKGGDWQGIIDKIPYIKGMGYTAIWISPITDPQLWSIPDENGIQGPTAYHGYHAYDVNRANRYFGAENPQESKEVLKELVDKCHEADIKVFFDVVPNHMGDFLKGTGDNAHYSSATSYKEGTQLQPAAPFNNPLWYHNLGDIDWNKEFPRTAESIQMMEDHDLSMLDDIDYDIPEAKQAMFEAMKNWYDYTGADGARIDAAKCMHPSDIHDLQEYLNVPTFGENFDMDVSFVSQWVGDNGETGMLDFPLFQAMVNSFAHGDSFNSNIKAVLDKDYLYGDNANEMMVFLDNHDRNRFLTEAGGNIDKLQNALTFLFTVRGNPIVFQGTEQNKGNLYDDLMVGLADTWNRWSMVEKDENGNVIADYFNTGTDTYHLIAELNELKDAYPALSYGVQREMWSSDNLYAFSRRIDANGDEIICAFNNSDTKKSAYVSLRAESSIQPGTVLENVMDSSDRITVSRSNKIALEVQGNSNKIYKVSNDQEKKTVPVTFYVHNATTTLGQSVYITGNKPELGNWSVGDAAGPASCPTYPDWSVSVNLPVGEKIEFKAAKYDGTTVEWESGDNREFTIPEEGGALSINWNESGITELAPVKFVVTEASTNWGENIYIAGNVAELGSWDADMAAGPALCPDYPTWEVYIDVPVGKKIEWKALKKGTDSTITWQSGSNNLYTVPDDGGCGETASSWR